MSHEKKDEVSTQYGADGILEIKYCLLSCNNGKEIHEIITEGGWKDCKIVRVCCGTILFYTMNMYCSHWLIKS